MKNPDLVSAVKAFGLRPQDFPTEVVSGGYSDDCPVLRMNGLPLGQFNSEYTPRVARIALGDGRDIVLMAIYEHNDWVTYLALPHGVIVEVVALGEEDR